MNFAIYTTDLTGEKIKDFIYFLNLLKKENILFFIHKKSYEKVKDNLLIKNIKLFSTTEDLIINKIDFVVSFGGDGTFLNILLLVKNTNIPILGINMGRLGFLADVSIEETEGFIRRLKNGKYNIERRSILELSPEIMFKKDENMALNDIVINKREAASINSIEVFLDGKFLNRYWADGIIVSSPIGSTAYSLSCGGPIVHPKSQNFVITPISPHNLSVRPIVVPDNIKITLKVQSREESFLLSLDSRSKIIKDSISINIKKANFYLNVVIFNEISYYKVLHEKLKWGLDKRN